MFSAAASASHSSYTFSQIVLLFKQLIYELKQNNSDLWNFWTVSSFIWAQKQILNIRLTSDWISSSCSSVIIPGEGLNSFLTNECNNLWGLIALAKQKAFVWK